jgi:hypothetical protein
MAVAGLSEELSQPIIRMMRTMKLGEYLRSGKFLLFSIVSVALSIPAGVSVAQDNKAAISNLRCLVIALHVSQTSDEQTKKVWSLGSTYFLGRYDTERGSSPLLPALRNEVKRLRGIDAATFDKEMLQCGTVLSEVGQSLLDAGKALP